ncbi:hypothetical protein K0M31_000046 [Melipona bicolor]|uniref:Uncharacterized protein n=1 Tax=Melipona bicolor TaxID=60889 RepID=A0AA40GCU2_9HYME|nr:hypothetical protein K0M31_000046 [Melipona bicolor]
MSCENVNAPVATQGRTGYKVRFPDESNLFYEESFYRSMLGTPLNHGVAMTRDDRSEQDLDSYNEGGHGLRTDKRELGHR